MGHAEAHGEERLEDGLVGVVAEASYLACRRHIDAEDGVGAAEAREAELRGLDADVVEVEGALVGLVDVFAEHDACGEVDKVDFEHFRHEGEATRGTQVALDHLDIVVLGEELDVEGT